MQNFIFLLVGALILYRIYLRVRRTIDWQLLNPGKMKVFTGIFCVVGLLILAAGASQTISLISDLAGIAIGIILACLGASMTVLERRDGQWYYRPNIWIGSIVTVLFVGRLIMRIYEMRTKNMNGMQGFHNMATGWTAGLLLIAFAYYAVYNMLLLWKRGHAAQPR